MADVIQNIKSLRCHQEFVRINGKDPIAGRPIGDRETHQARHLVRLRVTDQWIQYDDDLRVPGVLAELLNLLQ